MISVEPNDIERKSVAEEDLDPELGPDLEECGIIKYILIENRLHRQFEFEVITNKPDGCCLFRAIAQAQYKNQNRHAEVREKVVDYITDDSNWKKYLPFIRAQHDHLIPPDYFNSIQNSGIDTSESELKGTEINSLTSERRSASAGKIYEQNIQDWNNNLEIDTPSKLKSELKAKIKSRKSSIRWKQEYLLYMRCGTAYGTMQEMLAAGEIFKFNLIVIREVDDIWFNVQNFKEQNWVQTRCFYFTGDSDSGHFELLSPVSRDTLEFQIPNGDYKQIAWNPYRGLIQILEIGRKSDAEELEEQLKIISSQENHIPIGDSEKISIEKVLKSQRSDQILKKRAKLVERLESGSTLTEEKRIELETRLRRYDKLLKQEREELTSCRNKNQNSCRDLGEDDNKIVNRLKILSSDKFVNKSSSKSVEKTESDRLCQNGSGNGPDENEEFEKKCISWNRRNATVSVSRQALLDIAGCNSSRSLIARGYGKQCENSGTNTPPEHSKPLEFIIPVPNDWQQSDKENQLFAADQYKKLSKKYRKDKRSSGERLQKKTNIVREALCCLFCPCFYFKSD